MKIAYIILPNKKRGKKYEKQWRTLKYVILTRNNKILLKKKYKKKDLKYTLKNAYEFYKRRIYERIHKKQYS